MADVASSFKNWSASAASNNPTSATVIGSGLAPNLQQIQATLRTELGARSGAVTAASTVDLNAVDEGTVLVSHVSGTVSIVSFGTVGAGIKKLVTFSVSSGTLTLVYNATSMILPSNAADISVANGDSLVAESLGSGSWKIHSYTKSNGQAIKSPDLETAASDPTFSSTSAVKAASPEWIKSGWAISFSTTGYIKLPNWLGGWIAQWGSGTGVLSFPLAFPNAALNIFVQLNLNSGTPVGPDQTCVTSLTTTSFTRASASNTCRYFVVGY